mmetsp:Transcript_75231/g.179598  ORF Transcript_75231/g.179598 Transcript_75231/m.179598 type:complete len:275 (-) Transcript_75231:169-993(-)
MAFFVISALAVTVLGAAESDPDLFTNDPFPSSQLRSADYLDADEGETGRSNKWLKDINTRTKNHFKKLLAPLQTPIVQEYEVVGILDTYVNYTMELVANATGHSVIWNRTSGRGLSEPRGLRPSRQELPPRARYINEILMYLNKEMEAVWNYITMVDRKRWGVGNVITSSPYGPHGEHPERWRANGTFPMPLAAPVSPVLNLTNTLTMHVKAEEHKYDNKYAQQLQADYQSLIDNINDASKKCNDLRARLFKMDVYANQFIVLPSGVWNKIDAN